MPNNNSCFTPLQRSLGWCQGMPVLPGIRRRLYYTSKQNIVQWPNYSTDNGGRYSFATVTGNFALKADTYWYYIDILAEKSTLTSDPQGGSSLADAVEQAHCRPSGSRPRGFCRCVLPQQLR